MLLWSRVSEPAFDSVKRMKDVGIRATHVHLMTAHQDVDGDDEELLD